jgi:hypothetical protein
MGIAQGASMAVQRFMALHKPYLPIKAQQLIRPSQLEFVGLVDAQRRDRFGPCARVCESRCPMHRTCVCSDLAAMHGCIAPCIIHFAGGHRAHEAVVVKSEVVKSRLDVGLCV